MVDLSRHDHLRGPAAKAARPPAPGCGRVSPVSVTLCNDVSAAAWIQSADLSWGRLVCLGPDGFKRYARLRFIPDLERPDQYEGDVLTTGDPAPEIEQLRTPADVLRAHTSTPQSCFFGLWDGWGMFPAEGPTKPAWVVPDRDSFLFHGPLDALSDEAPGAAAVRSGMVAAHRRVRVARGPGLVSDQGRRPAPCRHLRRASRDRGPAGPPRPGHRPRRSHASTTALLVTAGLTAGYVRSSHNTGAISTTADRVDPALAVRPTTGIGQCPSSGPLMLGIGQWVLNESCRMAAMWSEQLGTHR